MSWIPYPNEDENYPKPKEWAQVMTQDGTVYPAMYNAGKKTWVPVFRGGSIESLMHGKVVYWCARAEGYPFARCDKGHGYLKTPNNDVCPTCKRFGFVTKKHSDVPAKEEPVPEAEPVVEPVEATV